MFWDIAYPSHISYPSHKVINPGHFYSHDLPIVMMMMSMLKNILFYWSIPESMLGLDH